jgi:hypothetical protein
MKADGSYASIANGCVILRDRNGAAARLIGVMRILAETVLGQGGSKPLPVL